MAGRKKTFFWQIYAIFLIFMLMLAFAIQPVYSDEHSSKKGSLPPKKNHKSPPDFVNQTCSSTYKKVFNKHNNMTYGALFGFFVPQNCERFQLRCLSEIFDFFLNPVQYNYELMRYKYNDLPPLANNIQKDLTHLKTKYFENNIFEEKEIFHKLERQFKLVSSLYINFNQLMDKFDGGDCGEQSARAAIKLLQEAFNTNTDIKIQIVSFFDNSIWSNLLNPPFRYIDHNCLFINSPFSDGMIKGGNNVKNFIDSFASNEKFHICDPWNNGYFGSSREANGIYTGSIMWTHMIIETVQFDVELLNKMPPEVLDYFNKQFEYMGIHLNTNLKAAFKFN